MIKSLGLQTSTNKIPESTIKTKEKTKTKVALSFGNDEVTLFLFYSEF